MQSFKIVPHGQRRCKYGKYPVLGRDRSFFLLKRKQNHTLILPKKFSETYIINMFEILIDNILAMFSGRVFQQTVSIHIGTSVRILLRRGVVDTTLCDKVC